MNNIVIQDSLKVAIQTIPKATEHIDTINWWMWFAIIEFGIIAVLILKKKMKTMDSEKQKFKKESLKQEIDFNNIINSSFNSNLLYNELKVKCHPDRFPTDLNKNTVAENLFQQITKNKNNVKELIKLKEEAIKKLNINF